jgi:hypothetical protein
MIGLGFLPPESGDSKRVDQAGAAMASVPVEALAFAQQPENFVCGAEE